MRPCGTKGAVDGEDKMVDKMKEDILIQSLMEEDLSEARVMFDPTFPNEYLC